MENMLFDKVYGCLIGGIIGDAMGAPVENFTYNEIAEKYGRIEDFEGQGTDDSAIKTILCEAIIQNNGDITADEFSEAFIRNKEKYYDLFFIPVYNMLHKVENKLELPVYAGLGNMQSSSSAMAIAPMGIINAFNPRQAAIETYDVAGLIHSGSATFCRDGACAIAAAVAEALKPEVSLKSIVEASTKYLHKISSDIMRTYIHNVMETAEKAGNYHMFREMFYEKYLQDVPCDSRETVPCAISIFYLSNGEPDIAIPNAVNFGRDADTIATMVGALCGAFKGASNIKFSWVEKADKAFGDNSITDSPQKKLANDLIDIIRIRYNRQNEMFNIWKNY